jgi:hypothetical protein
MVMAFSHKHQLNNYLKEKRMILKHPLYRYKTFCLVF